MSEQRTAEQEVDPWAYAAESTYGKMHLRRDPEAWQTRGRPGPACGQIAGGAFTYDESKVTCRKCRYIIGGPDSNNRNGADMSHRPIEQQSMARPLHPLFQRILEAHNMAPKKRVIGRVCAVCGERDRLRTILRRIEAYIRAHVDEPRQERNYVAANVLAMAAERTAVETKDG